MRTTEAYEKRTSRSKSPDLREKYPHWYDDNDNQRDDHQDERNDSDRRRSPDRDNRGLGFPSSYRRKSTDDDRESPNNYRGDSGENYQRYDGDRGRRSPEHQRYSYSNDRRNSPEERRSPEDRNRRSAGYRGRRSSYGRHSPEDRRSGDDRRQETPDRYSNSGRGRRSPEQTHYKGRSSSADSFQTVKIKKSDLDEIRRKYDLRFKNKEGESSNNAVESAKSKAYQYSSNMRNSGSEPSSSDGVSSSGTRYRTKSKPRKKREEWKVTTQFYCEISIVCLSILTAVAAFLTVVEECPN